MKAVGARLAEVDGVEGDCSSTLLGGLGLDVLDVRVDFV